MKDTLKRYGMATLVVSGLWLVSWVGYHSYQSYRRFEWQHVRTQTGEEFVLPSWRK